MQPTDVSESAFRHGSQERIIPQAMPRLCGEPQNRRRPRGEGFSGMSARAARYGISYTMNSSAMPRSEARLGSGLSPLVSRIDEDCGCSTTGSVAKIERDA